MDPGLCRAPLHAYLYNPVKYPIFNKLLNGIVLADIRQQRPLAIATYL
jgi:hypothetical protein